jgi:hypothetical protein
MRADILSRDLATEAASAAAWAEVAAAAAQPKLPPASLLDLARVLGATAQRSVLAGASVVAHLARCTEELASAAQQAQQLEGHAALLAAAAAVDSAPLRACLLACAPQLLRLLLHPRVGVRRCGVEAVQGAMLAPQLAWHPAALAALLHVALRDKDAGLRAKALGAVERHVGAVVRCCQEEAAAAAASQPAALADLVAAAAAARLADRTASVRRRAAQLAGALAEADLPAGLRARVVREVVPVACKLLALPPDAALSPGEASPVLTAAVISLVGGGTSAAATLHLLRLTACVRDARAAALVRGCVVRAALQPAGALLELVAACSGAEVGSLRGMVRAVAEGDARAASAAASLQQQVAADAWQALAQQQPIGGAAADRALALSRAAFVLSAAAGADQQASEAAALLRLAGRALAPLQTAAPPSREASEAPVWLFRAAAAALRALGPEAAAAAPLQRPLVAAVRAAVVAPAAPPTLRAAALAALQDAPAPVPAFTLLLALLARDSGAAAPAPGPAAAAPHLLVFDPASSSLVEQAAAPPPSAGGSPAGQRLARRAFVEALGAMAARYSAEHAAFLRALAAGERPGAGAAGPPPPRGMEVDSDYMGAEERRQQREGAARRFLEERLGAEDTVPVCCVPALLEAAGSVEASPSSRVRSHRMHMLGGAVFCAPLTAQRAPPALQAAALRALAPFVALSEPLCARIMPAAERCLVHQAPPLQAAAVVVIAAAIAAYPAALGGKLPAVGALMAAPPPAASAVPLFAAASYSRLLLSNRLKVLDLMGPLGAGLGGGDRHVAAVLRNTLRSLLAAAPDERDRAAIVMALFHQTPPLLRAAAVEQAGDLLGAGDRRCDLLAGQAMQAAVAAADSAAAGAAAALLRHLRPSARALTSLHAMLAAPGAAAGVRGDVRRALAEFVRSGGGGQEAAAAAAGAGAGGKRRRAAGVGEAAQEVLGLLDRGAAPRRRARREAEDSARASAAPRDSSG